MQPVAAAEFTGKFDMAVIRKDKRDRWITKLKKKRQPKCL